MADVLLIEPNYKNKYPPIGLMKISYFHRYIKGDYVRFTKGRLPDGFQAKKWDRVYVTTLFTFEWEKTKEALRYALSVVKPGCHVYTGGILATLRPEWISETFPEVINNPGLLNHKGTLGLEGEECVDTLPLDYKILEDIPYTYPAHDAYFTYMTRGCGMNCTFCAVKTLEPTYIPYYSISDSIKRIDKEFGPKRDLLLMDNNVLRSPRFDEIVDEIKALGFQKGATYVNPKTNKRVERHVDFNQGLDAFLLNEHKARRLGELAIKPARVAFDHIEDEEQYVKAITLCARNGIDYMSNYLLYNGEDFTGKGHKYKADTPEDLYYRMRLTMELAENLTEELGRRISIFSFPMRYIPLEDNKRGFVGENWNKKYLRAFQCMLIPTQGKGIQGRSFFEADFGKSKEEFIEFLAMPERLLNKRGFFVEQKNESEGERLVRKTTWQQNHDLINLWLKMYRSLDLDVVISLIGDNQFSEKKLDEIEDDKLKRFYSLYLTVPGFIRMFTECSEHTCEVILKFIQEKMPFVFDRIREHAVNVSLTPRQLSGSIKYLGIDFLQDVLEHIDVFDDAYSNHIERIHKVNRREHLVAFDFSLLKFLPLFSQANAFSEMDKIEIRHAIKYFDENKIREMLNQRIDILGDVLIKNNRNEPGIKSVIAGIKEQLNQINYQMNIFDYVKDDSDET